MKMEKFAEMIREEMERKIPDAEVEYKVVQKNGRNLDAIIPHMPGEVASPILYLDDAYMAYVGGMPVDAITEQLVSFYRQAVENITPPEIEQDYGKARSMLTVRLVDKSRYGESLEDIPHKDVGCGFALVADLVTGDFRATITKALLEGYEGVSKKTLLEDAMKNASPATLMTMLAAINNLPDNLLEEEERVVESDMYVLTNEDRYCGAATMFYPGVLEKAATILGENFYILPSSRHEVLLIPESSGIEEEKLVAMVYEGNRTVTEPNDVLSDQVLHYRSDGKLTKVKAKGDKTLLAS